LTDGKITVPTLEQLVAMRWDEFEGGEKKNVCMASIHYALSNMFLLFLQDKRIVDDMVEAYKNRIKTRRDSLDVGISNTELVEKVTRKSIAGLSTEFYQWLDQNYNIDFQSIIKSHPYTSPDRGPGYLAERHQELPARIEQSLTRVDSLMQKLKMDSLMNTAEISRLQDTIYTLKNTGRNIYQRLVDLNSQEIRAAYNTGGGKETIKQNEIKQYEEQLAALENKLQIMEQDLSARLLQKSKE
jgi:hypothetical protein